ncbi:MAG: hypothetical protein FWC00_03965 [Firmicutes bacterium]|nr:hypothetical protein [Bacillota bacterium]
MSNTFDSKAFFQTVEQAPYTGPKLKDFALSGAFVGSIAGGLTGAMMGATVAGHVGAVVGGTLGTIAGVLGGALAGIPLFECHKENAVMKNAPKLKQPYELFDTMHKKQAQPRTSSRFPVRPVRKASPFGIAV